MIAVRDRTTLRGLTQFPRRSSQAGLQTAEYKRHQGTLGFEGPFCDNQIQAARNSLILKRRDVGVVDRARLEIALAICDGVLRISITVAKPTT
jgi:hypothetical protein